MHLSYEEKAKLIEGKLGGEEREKYLKHLAECDECFETLADSVNIIEKIKNQEIQKRFFMVIIRRKRYIPLLAAAIFIISLPFIWKIIERSLSVQQTYEFREILVGKGEKKKITLADGTQVLLDSGSRFKYPQNFYGENRSVFLNGEGYFNVTPNNEKQFIINANHAEIKVLGTKFNVRAWRQSRKVAVAVAEGKVLLRSKSVNQKKSVLISKGQYSILPKNGAPTKPHHVDIDRHVSWIDRDIAFDNTPLREILDQLERWYDVRFILDGKISVSDLITVHAKSKPIDEIIELIAYIAGFKYKIAGHKIYLYIENVRRIK
jgi:transmembrane sensor